MTDKPILIVGAGPTGLVLALDLARRGVAFRIISQDAGPGQHSRAMGVQARTLEFYDQFDFADEVVAAGIKATAFHIRENGRDVAHANLRDMGEGLSPYPYLLSYPQDDHERLLLAKLKTLGVEVEWRTKLTSFEERQDGVVASISHDGGAPERAESSYICGCDGAHSQVRQTLGIEFAGGTYPLLFYVADVQLDRDFGQDFYVNLGEQIVVLTFPVRSTGMQRLIGLVPPKFSDDRSLAYEDIRSGVKLLGAKVTTVNWFSAYRVHHRVASHFRVGRAFLAGDAGHVHSPVGGQGMNTGIGDAYNLGWKLAAVVQGRADAKILDTYEAERIGFARSLVATTDRAFTPLTATGWRGALVRRFAMPLIAGFATRLAFTRHLAFRLISQIRIAYPGSALSAGEAGAVKGGDRLPWTGAAGVNNFPSLRRRDWQAHVYGEPEAGLAEACASLGLPLQLFAFDAGAQKAGLQRDATYLIRPDGYVALAATSDAAAAVKSYAEPLGLKFAARKRKS